MTPYGCWLLGLIAERDLMELTGWASPQMVTCTASARGARARRSYDRIMWTTEPDPAMTRPAPPTRARRPARPRATRPVRCMHAEEAPIL